MKFKMTVNGQVAIFRPTYQCPEYIFCECDVNPSLRGFFTINFLKKNSI